MTTINEIQSMLAFLVGIITMPLSFILSLALMGKLLQPKKDHR